MSLSLPSDTDLRAYIASLNAEDKAQLDRLLAPQIDAITLGNPEWRIDNLYWIQDEHGKEVRFVRNEAQRRWWAERWYLNVILKARQLGFSTEIGLEMLDTCLFNDNVSAGIIDYSLDDATKKLAKIKFTYSKLDDKIKKKTGLVRANTETIEFANGSRIEVGTSHRGGTLQHLHVSEYGKISALRPDKAKEIKTGGFGTVHVGQRIDVESTAEGIGGEFHDLVQRSDALKKENRPLSPLDFKLHFFAWWQHHGYRIEPKHARIAADLEDYFSELSAHGINLDLGQRAWYAAKRYQIGPDNMFREYPSFPEEAFKTSIDGAYFKRQMSKMRIDGRLCEIPHDESRLVNTFWDIGNDTTAIWFHQTDGVRNRLIDYYENVDEQIGHYAMELRDLAQHKGYRYGKHLGPHDFGNTEWAGKGKSRKDIAYDDFGLRIICIPRVDNKNDAIDVARQFLGMCWINTKNCEKGIQCLDNYRKKWNEQLATWGREPLHDWASHGADALMTGAMGYRPEKPEKEKPQRMPAIVSGDRSGNGWMSV